MGPGKIENHLSPSKQTLPPNPHSFETLILLIQSSPQDLKPSLTKSIYFLLLHSSLNAPLHRSDFESVRTLSNILFEDLDRRFKQFFFSDLRDVFRGTRSSAKVWASVEQLILILRCCLVALNLLEFDPNLLWKKVRVLLLIVRVLVSSVSESSVKFEKLFGDDGDGDGCTASVAEEFVAELCFLKPLDPCRPFLCALIEVLADELLINKSLRKCFMLVDSASGNEALFMCHFGNGDIESVLEVVSAHFVLSFSDGHAFDNFINRLVWQHDNDFRIPELSLTPAMSLLFNPVILSAPKMFQAHLISLVSDAIGIGMSSKTLRPDLGLMNCYLTTFERSVILYTKLMSSLQVDDNSIGSKGSVNPCMLGKSNLTFDLCVQQGTINRVYKVVSKSDDLWEFYLRNMFFGTKSDLMAGSISYLKESGHVFEESSRDENLSILDCIILNAFSDDVSDTVLYKKGKTNTQDIYLLGSILKLMSSSLVQAIWCLRHSGNLGCLKTLENAASHKEYDFMVGIIHCFQESSVYLPVQRFLRDIMKIYPTRHKESKWMFLHFSGLLSLSFKSGLNFLVKGCISIMMALMNLFAFEEGNLAALRSLLGTGSVALSSVSYDKVQEAQLEHKSSKRVASRFQEIQVLHLSTDLRSFNQKIQNEQAETSQNVSILNHTKESADGTEEETVKTCNGETFLKCILGDSKNLPDFDDLADFIECKQGKDYRIWLKDKQRHRKWKGEKMAVLSFKKKRKTWKLWKLMKSLKN
ncbi:hypothetical protein ACB098_12G017800 [Castanea mollissima]